MKIVVLNGSASGLKGITAHYVQYLERRFPEHQFQTFEVARRIHEIERDRSRFDAIVKAMVQADLILWAFPVIVMLVSAQLKRFIELLFDRVGSDALAGKVASSLSTSAHHYDHTAHDYVQQVSSDLRMTCVRGFSAGMQDILGEKGRRDLLGWARDLFRHAVGDEPVDAPVPPLGGAPTTYAPTLPAATSKTSPKRIVVISDARSSDHNLRRMLEVFERSVSIPVDRIDLDELRMDGACLACLQCGADGKCGYRDDYAAAFDGRVRPADVVIYAGAVRDRFLSARMKTFIDRYFSNGHRPVLSGKAMGFIVSGPLQQLPTLREVLEAHIEVAGCQRLGIVTDEDPDSGATTRRLQALARTVDDWAAEPWYTAPTFRGFAAAKNFRDLVYDHRGMMIADHRYYRSHGLYDFPQKKLGWRLFNALLLLLYLIPPLRKRLKRMTATGHTRAYRQLLEADHAAPLAPGRAHEQLSAPSRA